MKKDYNKMSLVAHKKFGGKLQIASKFKLKNRDDLSIAYTPGVAAVCMEIFNKNNDVKNKLNEASIYTLKKNMIAVISDGSAVLGLGNIGASAAIPVMEGKSVLMKHFADVDAFPICLQTQDVEEIINIVKNLEPVFGGINLEDIAAPKCFEIEERLKKEMNIPVMHDDQWGAAVVTLSGLINSLKVVKKSFVNLKIVVSGVGAAGLASIRLIKSYNPDVKIYALDSKGVISLSRYDTPVEAEKLNADKKKLIDEKIIETDFDGDLAFVIQNTDVFIGLSKPNVLTIDMVNSMNHDPIIFGLANPTPEISFVDAAKSKVAVFATGRSDYPNQINNSLFFPGFWKGILARQAKGKGKDYDFKMLHAGAEAIAKMVKPKAKEILPSTLDMKVHKVVAKVIENFKA
jgi:malate dehydrogenase (oxaloacetate-decarboxylating)